MTSRVVLFYTVMIGFAIGIFLRSFIDFGLAGICLVLLLSFGVGLVWRKNSSAVFSPHLLIASVFLFLCALGMFRMDSAQEQFLNSPLRIGVGDSVTLEGVIVREPDERENTTHLIIKTDGGLILVYADRYGMYAYGDAVTVSGTLAEAESFETDLGRTFDYPNYLRARGVGYIVKYAVVSVTEGGHGNPVIASLLDLKHSFMAKIETLLPEPHVGLSEGLLLGVKRALGAHLESVFRETGIIHIVVLSGYNIMLVVLFVTFVLGAILPARWQLPFGVAAIAAFALIVGLSATVVRASVMATLYLVARTFNRTYMVTRALLLAGAVMLLLNPYLLAFDTGFQLSFVATLGLILLAPHIESWLSLVPKFLGAREFLTATIATQIFVSPILLYQIGQFSVVAVVVNVLVLPAVPLAMLLTFLTGLIGFISTALANVLAVFTYLSLAYILVVAEWFAALPFSSYMVPAFPFWVVVVSYMGMGYFLWWLSHAREPEQAADEDELVGWAIEEDPEMKLAVPQGGTASKTPIFFR